VLGGNMKNSFPVFFTDNNVFTPLSEGEKELVIKPSFPKANLDNIKFLAYSSLNVMSHYPKQDIATLLVDRVSEVTYFPSINASLPTKITAPKFIGKVSEIYKLCNLYYCEPINFKAISNASFILKEYHFQYNCIGWALGIYNWVEPVTVIKDISNLTLLEKTTSNFLKFVLNKYNKNDNSSSMVFDVIKNITSIHCAANKPLDEDINIDGVVAFYFTNNSMTHAARYVSNFQGHELNNWASKIGHSIMISHNLEDLSGDDSIYGNPLCYGRPNESNLSGESECESD
jgi:hypothetical protein